MQIQPRTVLFNIKTSFEAGRKTRNFIIFIQFKPCHFRGVVSGGTIKSKMRHLRLVFCCFSFLFCVLKAVVLCYVLFGEMGSVWWCKQLFPLCLTLMMELYFSMLCSLQWNGSWVSFLLPCTFSRKWHNPRALQADAKGEDMPKIVRYKVHFLGGTIHPCLKSPCNEKTEIELIASCCLRVKKLPTTKWPEKNQSIWVGHFPELQD